MKTLAALCLLLTTSVMLGSNTLVVENVDLLKIRGHGEFQVTNGAIVHLHSENGEHFGLFSRNNGALNIVLSIEDGEYEAETWSIAADPMNPERVHQAMIIVVGDEPKGPQWPSGPVGVEHLLALLSAWGPCSGNCIWDLNGDGVVDIFDMLELLSMWGT